MAVGFGFVALTDDDLLFEFTHRPEAMAEARADLEKFGDTYRLQLIAAMYLTHQAATSRISARVISYIARSTRKSIGTAHDGAPAHRGRS